MYIYIYVYIYDSPRKYHPSFLFYNRTPLCLLHLSVHLCWNKGGEKVLRRRDSFICVFVCLLAAQYLFSPPSSMAIQADQVTDQAFWHDSAGGFLIPQHQQLMMRFDLPKELLISSQIEKQRMEIDRFISSQNERLRQVLQEQRKTQLSIMLKKYETKIQSLLRQKDEEISKAKNRRMELENLLRRMEIESQTWQTAAKEKEAIAGALNGQIQRLRETAGLSINAAEDAESCTPRLQSEDDEDNEQNTKKMLCRCCGLRKACVVMIPCRHLCSCKDCEAFLDSCPVCKTAKNATLEALTL